MEKCQKCGQLHERRSDLPCDVVMWWWPGPKIEPDESPYGFDYADTWDHLKDAREWRDAAVPWIHAAQRMMNDYERQLAAANERVGELEREQENLRMAWRRGSDPFLSSPGSVKIGFWSGDYDTINRILGGGK